MLGGARQHDLHARDLTPVLGYSYKFKQTDFMTQDTSKPEPSNSTETLIRSLEAAEIPYNTDSNGRVIVTPDIVEFLESRDALTPETPVVKTKEELLFPEPEEDGRSDEDKGYTFTKHDDADEVEAKLKSGDYKIGESDLKAKSDRHRNVEIYIGPVKELQGLPCLVQRNPKDVRGVACQFDDRSVAFNDRALGYGWHDFPVEHISDTRPFIDKWKDVPAPIRSQLRKPKGLPRLHPTEHRFLTPKEERRGIAGAFGGTTSKLERLALSKRKGLKTYLLNIICEGDAPDKSLAVRATNLEEAKGGAFLKHHREFPDVTITDIEVHEEVAA